MVVQRLLVFIVTVGMLLLIGAAVWAGRVGPLPHAQMVVVVLPPVVLALLLVLRPDPALYGLGLLMLLLASWGVWRAGFDTGWTTGLSGNLALLFPVGWVCLALSVTGWRVAVASYLLPGAVFTGLWLAFNWFGLGAAGAPPVWIVILFPLLWPVYALNALGVFTWAPVVGL